MATSSKKVKAQENVAASEINPQYAAKIKMLKDTLASNNTALNTQKAATNKNYNTEVGSQNAANTNAKSNFTNANVNRGIGNTPMVSTGINEMNQINNKYVGAINKRRSSALNNIDDRLKLSQKSYDNTASTMDTNKGIEINNLSRNYADKQVAKEYQAGRDSVSDNHWTSGFNHTKNRDNVADSHYNSEKATDNSRYNASLKIAAQKLATDNSRYNDSTRIAAQKLATDNSRYNDKTTIAAQKLKTDNARYDATTKLKAQAVITDNEHYAGTLKAAADKIANSPSSKKGAADINDLLNNKGAYAKLTYDERMKKLNGYGNALSKKDDSSSKYLLGLVNNAKSTLNNELNASKEANKKLGGGLTTGINPLTGKAQINMPYTTAVTPSKAQTDMMVKKAKESDDKTATIKANLPILTKEEIEATIPKPAPVKLDYLNQLLQPKNTVKSALDTATENSLNKQTEKVLPYKSTVVQPSAIANKPLPDEKNPEMAISYRDKKFSTTDIKAMNAAIDKETNPFKKAGLKLTQNLGYLLDTPDRNSFINRALETGRSSATGGSYKSNGKSTGNGLIDFAADVIGSAGGFSALESQGAIKLGQIGTTAENTIAKLTGKTMGNYAVNKAANKAIEYGVRAASTGTEFAGINATETAMQGGNLKETAQSATKGFISGALWGAGGKALGEAGNKIANSKFSTSIKTELTSKVLKTKGYSEVVPESGYWVKTAERSKGKTSLMVGKPKVESVFVENSNYVDTNNVRISKWKMQLIDKIGTTKEKTQLKDILSQYKEGMKDAPKETNTNGDINPKSTVNNRNSNINNADPNIQDVNFKDANVKDTNVAINNPAFDVDKTVSIKGMGDLKVVSKQNGKVSLKHEDGSVLNMSEDDLNQLSSEGKYEQPNGEDESIQPNHDEINQAQGLAQTANNLENMSQQKNDIMEATKRKVIQINRNNAQRVLNKVQKDTSDKPISDVGDNGNTISTPQNNVQYNASNEGLNSIDDIYKDKNIINNTMPEKEINSNDEYVNRERSNEEQDAINQEFNNIEANTPTNENVQHNANSKDLDHIADTSKMIDTADYNNGISNSNEMKSVKVNSIGVDPKRFQFKEETDSKTGASDKLKGTNKFIKSKAGAITVWQDNQGKNWVINGHHRVELAQRTNTDSVNALLLKESDGYTAEKARETGAMQNIAEGQGTAKDAAQVFRDGNYTIEDLKKEGLSTKDKSIEKGYNIAQLNDRLYSHVVNKTINYDKASLIGKEFPKGLQENEANQNAVMDYVQKNNPNESELNEAIYMIKGSQNGMVNDVEENEQMSLDGLETSNVMGNNFASKMKLISELKHTLVSNKNVFNKAIKNSGILSEAGNVLNTEGNTDKKAMLDNVIKVIDQGKGKKGDPVNDILNTYATKIGAEGMNNKTAVGHVTTEIVDYMSKNNIAEQINNPTNETDGQIDMFGGNENGNVEQGNNKSSIEVKGNEQTSPGAGIIEGETTGAVSKEIENNIPFNAAMTETPSEPLKEDLSSLDKVKNGLVIGDKVNLKRWGNLEVIDSKNENSAFIFKNEKGNDVKLSTNAIKRLANNSDKVVSTIKSTADNQVVAPAEPTETKLPTLKKDEVSPIAPTNHRYYLTQRPPSIGTHPRGTTNVVAFDNKQPVEGIGKDAWGYVDYDKELTDNQANDYELTKDANETPKVNSLTTLETKKDIADTADSFTYSKDDISYDTIKDAYRMISYRPEERAKSMQKQYVSHMKEIQENLSKYAETPGQKAILNDSLIKYKNKYIQMQNSVVAATSRTASPMITGPAKFPVAKNNKAIDTEHKRTVEFLDFIEKAQKSIKKKILNGMNAEQNSSAEYERLKNEVMSTISTLKEIENGSGYNASSFKTGLSGMLKRSANNGHIEEVKKALKLVKTLEKEHLNKPVFAKNNSIWNHAEKATTKIAEQPTGEVSVAKYEGAEILNNYDAERTQILFDVKPPTEVTQALSKEGWHYSRTNSAWQRKITPNSERSAKNIVSKFHKEVIVPTKSEKVSDKLPTLVEKKKEVTTLSNVEYADTNSNIKGEVMGPKKLEKKYGIKINIDNTENLHSSVFSSIEKSFDKINAIMPEGYKIKNLMDELNFVKLKENSIQHGGATDRVMTINANKFDNEHFNTEDELLQSYNSTVSNSIKTMSSTSTMTHEIGHLLEEKMLLELKGKNPLYAKAALKVQSDNIRKEVLDKFELTAQRQNWNKIAKQLSDYATESSHEFFAESFSEMIDNPEPRPMAKEFEKVLFNKFNKDYSKENKELEKKTLFKNTDKSDGNKGITTGVGNGEVNKPKKLPVLGEKKKEVKVPTEIEKTVTPEDHYNKLVKFNRDIKRGKVNAQQVKDQFEYLVANESVIKEGIFNNLKANPKYKGKRKTTLDKYTESLFDKYIERMIYTDKNVYSTIYDFSGNAKKYDDKRKLINDITDESINKFRTESKAKYEAEKAKNEKSLSNPETIAEFRTKKEQSGLSAEEQRTYEDLIAKRQNKKADIKAEDQRTKDVAAISNIDDMFESPIKDVNTKTNEDLWVVKFKNRIDKETYVSVRSEIKKIGGYYSNFKKGFIFKEDPTESLKLLKNGGSVTNDKVDTSKNVADKLKILADNMQSEIDNSYADRQENTSRRAGMAANAREHGDSLKETQTIMRKIADAIENGEAEHLKGITARTHINTLEYLLGTSKRLYAQKVSKEKFPADYTKRNELEKQIRNADATIEMIDNAEYPKMSVYSSNLMDLVNFTKEFKGSIKSSAKYIKLAEKNTGERVTINEAELKEIESLVKVAKAKGIESYHLPRINYVDEFKRLNAMGIETVPQLRAALREFLPHTQGAKTSATVLKQREVRNRELELSRTKIDGYFPTPKNTVNRMIEEADIKPGEKILEPSAGTGHIADNIKDQYADNRLDVVEYNNALNELLSDKGHNVVGNDFLKQTGEYDKIIMNPPFEKGQDVDHVMHAYELLKPGGKIVSIMSEHPFFASDKKSVEFKRWLGIRGTSEKLSEGTFNESDRKTGVNTRMVIIEKSSNKIPTQLQGHKSKLESKQNGPNPDALNFNRRRTDKDVDSENVKYNSNVKYEFEDAELARRYNNSHGVEEKTRLSKIKAGVKEVVNMSTRTFRNIEANEKNSEFIKEMVQYPKLKNLASDDTIKILDDVTYDLNKNTFNTFSRKVLLDDLIEEVNSDHLLPLGFTPESVEKELIRIKPYITREVQQALDKRTKYWDTIKDEYVNSMGEMGIDISNKFNRKNYFRHQVLEYINLQNLNATNAIKGEGNKMKTPLNRGFSKERAGTTMDINTDYLQAEYEVMAQMVHDKAVAKMIVRIKDNYDVSETLKTEAKSLRSKAKAKGENLKIEWTDLLPENYSVWQPREGNAFISVNTLSEKMVNELTEGLADGINVKVGDVKKAMALGGKYKQYVIPTEIANKLDELYKVTEKNPVSKLSKKILNGWKHWVLTINPLGVTKYNIRNMVGDIDAAMLEPGILKYSAISAREVYAAMKNGRYTKNLKEFRDVGGFEDLTIAQEIGDVNSAQPFDRFKDKKELPNLFKKYTDATSSISNYRESILRYAAYLHYKKALTDGKIKYGASNPALVKGLHSTQDKAYKLSKDLLGAYDEISETGQVLRDHWIPFFSWVEVNFKRYTQAFKNAGNSDIALEQLINKNKSTNGVNVAMQKIKNLGATSSKAVIVTAMLMLWNALMFSDDEDKLPKSARETPHIILGNDKDGKIIYFNRLGSFSDYIDWFSMDNIQLDISDIKRGRKTIKEQFKNMAKAPLNKIASSINPFMTVIPQTLAGKKVYPDVFNMSTIRDKSQFLAQSASLGVLYNKITGIPTQGDELQTAVIYKSDPEYAAYNNTLDIKRDFEKQRGKEPTSNYATTPKSNALYYYKLALKYDDTKAADKWGKKYAELGGTEKGMAKSLAMMDPLYGYVATNYQEEHPNYKNVAPKLEEKDKLLNEFMDSLDEKEKEQLELAQKYYNSLIDNSNSKLPMLE